MNLAAFRAAFPEFDTADDALVNAHLDMAEGRVDSEVFGDNYDAAHGYMTAHLLAISPYGNTAKLVAKDGTTTYGKNYEGLKMQCGPGWVQL